MRNDEWFLNLTKITYKIDHCNVTSSNQNIPTKIKITIFRIKKGSERTV